MYFTCPESEESVISEHEDLNLEAENPAPTSTCEGHEIDTIMDSMKHGNDEGGDDGDDDLDKTSTTMLQVSSPKQTKQYNPPYLDKCMEFCDPPNSPESEDSSDSEHSDIGESSICSIRHSNIGKL